MSTISIRYDRGAGTLVVEGDLEDNAEQRRELAEVFSQAAKEGRKLVIETTEVSFDESSITMWTELTEEPLRRLEVEYPYSNLSMFLGYYYAVSPEDNPIHRFATDPPSLGESSEPPIK